MKGNGYNCKLPDVKEIKRLYDKDLSCEKIATMYGVTKSAVHRKFKRHNIKLRSRSDAQKINANEFKIEEGFLDFINGLLLGDGSLVQARHKKSCWYSHADKRKEYLIWLKTNLERFGLKIPEIREDVRDKGVYFYLHSISYRTLAPLRDIWYPYGKKRTPRDIVITPITLFNWYIGDGHYNPPQKLNGRRGEQVTISMLYDLDGRQLLSDKLKAIGIQNSVHTKCIYIKAESKEKFFRYIINHNYGIPSCYEYKFPERYCNGVT